MARALKVAPSEFDGRPWEQSDDPRLAQAHAGLVSVVVALDSYELGEDPGVAVCPWPEIAVDLDRLAELMHGTADYAGQGALMPVLLGELHAAYVRMPDRRREVLRGLITAYSSAMWLTKQVDTSRP